MERRALGVEFTHGQIVDFGTPAGGRRRCFHRRSARAARATLPAAHFAERKRGHFPPGRFAQMCGRFANDFDAPEYGVLLFRISVEFSLVRVSERSLRSSGRRAGCRADDRVGQPPYTQTAVARMCLRARWLGDFSNEGRRTKSTGAPTISSASPGISSNCAVGSGTESSSVTSKSTSLLRPASSRAAEPNLQATNRMPLAKRPEAFAELGQRKRVVVLARAPN